VDTSVDTPIGKSEPWERQPGETNKAYYAFTLYRDMGYKRSLVKVGQKYGGNRNIRALMERWSSQYNWVERVTAYDDYLELQKRLAHEEELEKMCKRHLTLSMALQSKAAEKLKDLEGKKMRVSDAIRAVSEGTKLERLTRGEPTEKVRGELVTTIKGPAVMPWENMPEARDAIRQVAEKLRREKNQSDASSS